jgi:hypothetical protein
MSEYSKTAMSWMGFREALLYFSYVIPLFEIEHLATTEIEEVELFRAHERKFLPPDISEAAVNDLKDIAESTKSITHHIIKRAAEQHPSSDIPATIGSAFTETMKGPPGSALTKAMASFYVRYKPSSTLPLIKSALPQATTVGSEDIAMTIASLKLIDTRDLTLKQLIEIRKDPETVEKLRRLRLFAYQNYQGKSKDFIEDDILNRLGDYERAVKKWGFTTASGAITTLLNSSLIAGGIAGSFLTAYYNAPLLAIASAMTGTGLAVANLAIGLGQQKFAREELTANNPVSYISYAKEKLEGK